MRLHDRPAPRVHEELVGGGGGVDLLGLVQLVEDAAIDDKHLPWVMHDGVRDSARWSALCHARWIAPWDAPAEGLKLQPHAWEAAPY